MASNTVNTGCMPLMMEALIAVVKFRPISQAGSRSESWYRQAKGKWPDMFADMRRIRFQPRIE